jgi:uracil-DNA glycosylase family 4
VNPDEVLREVDEQVRVCTDCKLHLSRKNAVPGEGPSGAALMFIGEGPGFHENEQGRPFVGAAGHFLEELLASIGLTREQVYITNIVKCRPPGNRDPQMPEITACSNYLERQIEAINPRVIVTLGRFSMARFMPEARISTVHGRARTINGRVVVPMYHPAAALHQPALRRVVEEDFSRLPEMIEHARESTPSADESSSQAQQLSLF